MQPRGRVGPCAALANTSSVIASNRSLRGSLTAFASAAFLMRYFAGMRRKRDLSPSLTTAGSPGAAPWSCYIPRRPWDTHELLRLSFRAIGRNRRAAAGAHFSLALNATMFVVGVVAGLIGQSSSLIADALDMLADASAYAIGLGAVGRSARFKAGAATLSGGLLLFFEILVVLDVVRRALVGSEPESVVMIAVAFVSFLVNANVLRLLGRYRQGEVHLRATWIFTRVDVIANIGVMISGLLVLLTGSRFPDLLVGGGIRIYVIKEAIEILSQAREARRAA